MGTGKEGDFRFFAFRRQPYDVTDVCYALRVIMIVAAPLVVALISAVIICDALSR